jgi:hypothetical protein
VAILALLLILPLLNFLPQILRFPLEEALAHRPR